MKRKFRADQFGNVVEINPPKPLVLPPLAEELTDLISIAAGIDQSPVWGVPFVLPTHETDHVVSQTLLDRGSWHPAAQSEAVRRLRARQAALGGGEITSGIPSSTPVSPAHISNGLWRDFEFRPGMGLVIRHGDTLYKKCQTCDREIPLDWYSRQCYTCLMTHDEGGSG